MGFADWREADAQLKERYDAAARDKENPNQPKTKAATDSGS